MSASTAVLPRTASASLPLILVVLSVGQLASNLAFTLWSPQQLTSGEDASPLVPPGAWFAVWAPIITLSIAWSIVAFRAKVRHDPLHVRIAAGLVVATAGFSTWLATAAFGQSNPFTVPVLAVMVLGLAWSARALVAGRAEVRRWPAWERLLVWATVGIYLGWTSMATFVNLATVLQRITSPAGVIGTLWQLGVLALAAGVAVLLVVATRGSLFYAATASYALVGVAVSTATQGYPALAIAAAVAVVLVIASAAILRLRDRRTTA